MPGHEFEKNVQQRLDELKLRPSDAVWNNVEKSIRDDKRRRRMILWIPLLLLFLGTSGYFLINKNGFTSAETAIKRNQSEKKNTLTSTPESKQENNTEKEKSEKANNPELATKNPNDNSIAKNQSIKNSTSNNRQSLIVVKHKSSKTETIGVKSEDKVILLTKDGQPSNLNNEQADALPLNSDEDPIKYSDVNLSLIKGISPFVSLTVPEKTNATLEPPAVDMNALSKLNQKDKYRSSKWQWGLDFSLGTSNAASELSFLSSAQMDNGGRVIPAGGLNVGNPQTSDMTTSIEPGTHWSAGGFVQRNFTNRFALSAGLQYSQYGTQIITSIRVDSNRVLYGNNFAVADPSGKASEYANRYHFLELPVTAHFKLNKSNNFPVYANAGLSVAWLLAANSSNNTTSIFNQNNDLYNKTQIGFHGGFTFGLLNKSKHPLQIGPSIRYNFSRLMENSSSNQHLVSFGLDVRLFLKK